jgi:hypothetical protein
LENQDCRFFYSKKEVKVLKHRTYHDIHTPEELDVACIGSLLAAIVPAKRRIDRAKYGRCLVKAEGGIFTPSGYFVPIIN